LVPWNLNRQRERVDSHPTMRKLRNLTLLGGLGSLGDPDFIQQTEVGLGRVPAKATGSIFLCILQGDRESRWGFCASDRKCSFGGRTMGTVRSSSRRYSGLRKPGPSHANSQGGGVGKKSGSRFESFGKRDNTKYLRTVRIVMTLSETESTNLGSACW